MYPLRELLKNDTSLVAGFLTLLTGLLTGPLLKLDPATAGSLTGIIGLGLTVWVRASVYSKAGAAVAATEAAVAAVQSVTADSAGDAGLMTQAGADAVQAAVQEAVPGATAPVPVATAA